MVNQVALYNNEKGLVEKGLSLDFSENFVDLLKDESLEDFSFSRDVSTSVYVRCLRNNIRAFSASTKTRSEVSFSNRKMWKQKGTGRARVKSAASPLWRKGGILFGPRPGGRKLLFNKSLSACAWRNLFLKFLQSNSFVGLDIEESYFPVSSKLFVNIIKACGGNIDKPGSVVLILSQGAINLARSAANISCVTLQLFGHLDFLQLAKADKILFLKSDKELFEKLVK